MNRIKQIFFFKGPWPSIPLFWVLVSGARLSMAVSALIAGLYAIGYTLVALGMKHETKLDLGVVLFWAGGIAVAFASPPAGTIYFQTYFSTFLYLSLAGMAYLPLAAGSEPFTVAFAKRSTPEMYWNTAEFAAINRIMTAVWAGIFIIALLISLVPTFLTQHLVPMVFVMGIGIPFTRKFPDAYLRKRKLSHLMADETRSNPPVPISTNPSDRQIHRMDRASDDERSKIANDSGPIDKVLVVFGSPRGKKGFTFKALDRFLNGMREGGAEPETLFLHKYDIRPCSGCYACWTKTPGTCIHKDDMPKLLEKLKFADLVIYAQPLYVFSVPGITKNFLDRQIPLLEPFLIERSDGSTGHPRRYKSGNRRRMLLFSVCGFPEVDHFNAMVEMFRLMSRAGDTPIIGEILRTSSESMRFGERMGGNFHRVMDALHKAGREVMDQGYVATATEETISTPFFSNVKNFRQLGNRFWETWISYEEKRKERRNQVDFETEIEKDVGMYFAGMAAMYNPEKADDLEGTFQFHINGDPQSVYYLEIKNRICRLGEGKATNPDVIIHTPLDVWKSIGEGKISGQVALMEGKYKVDGDLALLTKMGEIFR